MALTDHIRKDSPTNNFATWNSLDTTATVSDGNLKVLTGNVNTYSSIFLPKSGGKFYVEYYVESMGYPQFGIYNHDTNTKTLYQSTNQTNESILIKNVNTANAFTYSSGDIISVLVDTTNETIQWFKNGGSTSSNTTSSYTLDDLADNDYSFFMYHASGAGTSTIRINFGQDATFAGVKSDSAGPYTDANGIGKFYYQPPTGALALCTQNIPTPNMNHDVGNGPEDFFKCLTYSGTGSQQDITVGFKPDLVWAKSRTQTYGHMLYDTVRGQKHLNSDTTDTEVSDTQLTFHATDGFTVATGSGELNDATGAPNNFAAWCWRAGGAPSGATSATGSAKRINTIGTQDDTSCNALATAAASVGSNHIITPTLMSINQQTGFSIVKYIGGNASNGHTNANSALGMQGIPHGLGKYAKFVLIKSLDTASGWVAFVPHPTYGLGHNYHLRLDTTAAGSGNNWTGDNRQGISYIPDTDNVIYVGNDNMVSKQDDNFIMYVFTDIEGYSAFGSYTGNGSATAGPFIYTGHKVAWLMVKRTDSTNSWIISDNARNTYNVVDKNLLANSADQDNTNGGFFDFLSNGFKLRNADGGVNASGGTYIYMAFADQNFKYTTAR